MRKNIEYPIHIPVPFIKIDIGLGDMVKRLTDHFGIKLENCNCESRRQSLNRLIVFRRL